MKRRGGEGALALLKKLLLLLIFLLVAYGVLLSMEGGGAEAFKLRCPGMIDCKKVCNGFPNCCIDGKCQCIPCPSKP